MEGDCLEGPQGQIGKWDVSSITDMTQLFSSQTFFYGDLSKWDVSSVKDMSSMFQGAQSFNGDISKWDVSSVVEIPAMFRLAASFRGGISRWDVSRVVNMDYMFWYAVSFKQKLRGAAWVRSKASKNDMFRGSSGSIARAITLITASTTITAGFSSKAKLKDAVEACLKLSPDGDCSNSPHGPIAEWHVSSVTDMNNLFTYAKDFDGDLSKWDVSNVRDMTGMFMSATSFNGDLSKWDVSSVTSMISMFMSAASFNGDLSKWDVSSVTDMFAMFTAATSFNGVISKWDVSSVSDMLGMFTSATSFNGDISKWDVSSVTDMSSMFIRAKLFDCDISKWDVSRVVNMDSMFEGAAFFQQELCGAAWVQSKASKNDMFKGSPGSISRTVCTSATTQGTRQHIVPFVHVSRRPITERELIARTSITTSVSTPSITSATANTLTCSKCGTFRQSGRVSCCAPGGAWFKKCGGVGNINVDHMWSEGVEACKRKYKSNQ